jgi:hypothetical protein
MKTKSVTINVRKLDMQAVNKNKSMSKLEILYSGSMKRANAFCQKQGYKFQGDKSIYGGYYVNEEGDCLLLT